MIIKHSTEMKCYVCGRTPEDFGSYFDKELLKKAISKGMDEKSQKIQEKITEYIDFLKHLYKDTQAYQGNLTLGELKQNRQLAVKIAPKYEELAKFIPKQTSYKEHTIDQLRQFINKFIQELEQKNYQNLAFFNLPLSNIVDSSMTLDLDTFKPSEVEFDEGQIKICFDSTGKVIRIAKIIDGSIRPINKPAAKPIDQNKSIVVELTYYLCPICADILSEEPKYSIV